MSQRVVQEKQAGRNLQEQGFRAGIEEKKTEENLYWTFNNEIDARKKQLAQDQVQLEDLKAQIGELEANKLQMREKFERVQEDMDLHYQAKIRVTDGYIVDLAER